MKYKLIKFKENQGYIHAIKLSWWQPIVYYPFQICFAVLRFIIDLIPSWGLKGQLIDICHTKPTKDILDLKKKLF